MSAQALDDQYECLRLAYRPARIFDTSARAYRWVLLAPWQIGQPPQPADPDAALDEAAPLFAPTAYRSGQLSPMTVRVIGLLRECGPLSATVIAQRLGCARSTITGCIAGHPHTFERAGWAEGRHMLYRLRED